ncbi:MAG TPA: SUMF1/EgtB/PvdO family nonheme iron enzyme [Nitrospira sp.]|nr:SUMF1/EgtB/PvdO family nonheme iron enzyme [Nitrospira sp.]
MTTESCSETMRSAFRPRVFSLSFIGLIAALLIGLAISSPARANHESPAQPPLWTPLDEAERLAAFETITAMAVVPAGWFLMGSDPRIDSAAGPQELPQHRVYLDAFEIDMYEVSNVDYLRFVLATGADWPKFWRERPFPEKMALHPVINVNWHDADAYCQWAGKRLPTEAEWEKAARGEDGRIFPWGNEPAGWLKSNIAHPGSKRGTKYPPLANVYRYDKGVSPYGVHQLAGNVHEWVADWFDPEYYKRGEDRNPKGPDHGDDKVFRGGSWNEDPEVARSAGRNAGPPDHRSYLIGFRCAAPIGDSSSVKRDAGQDKLERRHLLRGTLREMRVMQTH